MEMRTRTMAALATALLTITACGTDAEPAASPADATPVDAATFAAAVEERCVQTNEEIMAAEEAFPGETSEDAAGYFAAFADAIDGFVDDVRAMDAPDDVAEGTERLLDQLAVSSSAMRDASEEFAGGSEDFEGVAGPAFGTIGQAEVTASEILGFSLQSCGEEAVVAAPDAEQITVIATDYAFDIPEVPAGKVAFTMENAGDEPHFMYVVKLNEGATLAEALEAEAAGEDPEQFVAEDVGESSTVGPGQTSVLNTELTPGTYGMLCFISAPEGASHAALGMAEEFTVG
jgi:hypothetical protein